MYTPASATILGYQTGNFNANFIQIIKSVTLTLGQQLHPDDPMAPFKYMCIGTMRKGLRSLVGVRDSISKLKEIFQNSYVKNLT